MTRYPFSRESHYTVEPVEPTDEDMARARRIDPSSSVRVRFDCGHKALILREEYGDGSAWCIDCDDFVVYARCFLCGSLDCRCPPSGQPA